MKRRRKYICLLTDDESDYLVRKYAVSEKAICKPIFYEAILPIRFAGGGIGGSSHKTGRAYQKRLSKYLKIGVAAGMRRRRGGLSERQQSVQRVSAADWR